MQITESLRFLTHPQIQAVSSKWGTPVFVYSEALLRAHASEALAMPAPYGLTVRYAMKANPNRHILNIFRSMGIKIDASSGFEAWRALKSGYEGSDISLATQELPSDFAALAKKGVLFNLCSMSQLQKWAETFPGSTVGVRINPGIGSGHSFKTNVGGPSSSFGIWHEQLAEVRELAARYQVRITRLHTHVGAGTDPAVWQRAAELSLRTAEYLPDVTVLDLGGGFKVARMSYEHPTNFAETGHFLGKSFKAFAKRTGRKLHLEIEPGTSLVANAGSLVTTIQDISSTGPKGYTFLKVNSGMTEVLRPMLYAAQHPLVVVNSLPPKPQKYVVVGHCCESGDLLTPSTTEPDTLQPRLMQQAQIGDYLVIEGVGGYCSALNAHGYNSFPAAAEVLLSADGIFSEIRRRETLDELIAAEYPQ